MISRRKMLLTTTAGIGAALAGCADADQTEPTDNNEEPQEPEETQTLENFSLTEIRSFSHTFSDGLGVTVELTNETDGDTGENRANVSMKAYVGEEIVGEDNEWNRAGPDGRSATYDLSIEAVSPAGEVSIDELTELRICGREPDGQNVELATFSGGEIQSKVD